jgi:polyhydroxybutyrate depolymerase
MNFTLKLNKHLNTKFKFALSTLLIINATNYCSAQYDSIIHNGLYRTFLLHLPENYSENDTLPLILAFHGGFGSAANLQEQSGLSQKANSENFIVVYPEGIKSVPLGIRTWNAGWCCGYASKTNSNDIGFVASLLDTLENQMNIDPERIYATGMSNGGFLTYRLACGLSDRIAAFAPVAASMSMSECKPENSVPIIHFHSYQDSSIPYQGGVGNGVSDHYNPPIDSVLNAFAFHNNCVNTNDTILNNEQYTYVKWSDCECNKEIQFYITQDGGHSWPGEVKTPVGDSTSKYINATDLMWKFFQGFTLNCLSTNSTEKKINKPPSTFPNPTNGILNLEISPEIKHFTIILYDSKGNLIEKFVNQKQINLYDLPKGFYIARIIYLSTVFQERIVLI